MLRLGGWCRVLRIVIVIVIGMVDMDMGGSGFIMIVVVSIQQGLQGKTTTSTGGAETVERRH